MFVKTTRRRRGDKVYEYLSLVESGQLERIVAALERHLRRERVDVRALAAEGAPGVGAVAAIWAVWQRLGLGEWFATVGAARGAKALEHAVFAMVANRLVAPCSKRRLVEWTACDVVMPEGWSAPSLDQYYRALGRGRRRQRRHGDASVCAVVRLDEPGPAAGVLRRGVHIFRGFDPPL